MVHNYNAHKFRPNNVNNTPCGNKFLIFIQAIIATVIKLNLSYN
jgi:hypothetical protein